MAQQIMGNRILGGVGSSGGGLSTSFGEGVNTALNQRTSRQQMQERDQAMQLRASQEARAQQQFQAQQAAAGRAAAAERDRRAMLAALVGGGATGATGAAPAPTAGVSVTPRPRQQGPDLGFNNLPAGVRGPAFPIGVPVTPSAPTVSGGGGTPALAGGGGTDTLAPATPVSTPSGQPTTVDFNGVPFAIYPDGRIVNSLSGTELPATGEFSALRTALTQRAGAAPTTADSRVTQAQGLGETIRGGVVNALDRSAGVLSAAGSGLYGLASDVLGPVAAAAGAPQLAATLERQSDIAYNAALANLRGGLSATSGLTAEDFDLEPAEFRAAVRQAEAVAATEPATPTPTPAQVAQTRAQTEAAVAELAPSVAGVQLPFASPVQLAFAQTEGAPSERYINNADLIQMDRDRLAQQAARQEQLLQYLAVTGDTGGFEQGMALVQAQSALAQTQIEQRYLDGMVAIASIQNGNFGPLQVLLQQRPEFQGRQVEVRPYTDGTVEIYVDGQLDTEMEWGDLVSDLQNVYDQGYQEFMQAQAAELASMARFDFEQRSEQAAIAEREILVAATEDQLRRAAEEGQLTSVTDANGTPTLQMRVNGVFTPVSIEETVSQVPGGGESIRYVIRRIDTGEVVPLSGE